MANAEVLKAAAAAAIDASSIDLKEISDKIWNNPELGEMFNSDTLPFSYGSY